MTRSVLRAALCLLVGSFAGGTLGPLFAPDPTGLAASLLTIGITVAVALVLYRSDWMAAWKASE